MVATPCAGPGGAITKPIFSSDIMWAGLGGGLPVSEIKKFSRYCMGVSSLACTRSRELLYGMVKPGLEP